MISCLRTTEEHTPQHSALAAAAADVVVRRQAIILLYLQFLLTMTFSYGNSVLMSITTWYRSEPR